MTTKGEEGVGLSKIWNSWVLSLLAETLPKPPRSNFQQWSSSVRGFFWPRHSCERRKKWSRIHVWQLFPLSFNSLWDRRIYKSQPLWLSRYFSRNVPSGPEERVEFSPRFHSTVEKIKFTEGWRNVNRQDTINYLSSRLYKPDFSSIRQSKARCFLKMRNPLLP